MKYCVFDIEHMYIVFAFKEGLTAYSFNPLRSKPSLVLSLTLYFGEQQCL